jgi:predicted methyltransferase
MLKYVSAACLVLALCACHRSGMPATTSSAAAPMSVQTAASSAFAGDQPDEIPPPRSAAELSAGMIKKVLASPARDKAAKKLDVTRHPVKTLMFFGLRPDMNVIELDPAGTWYAAILAPLLKDDGTFTIALVSPLQSKQSAQVMQALRTMFAAHPDRYRAARLTSFDPHTPNLGTPGSADMVLAFRSMHGWMAAGNAKVMLAAVFDVLRPGGIFGVIDNRAPTDANAADLNGMPYLRQPDVVKAVEEAGFKLAASSGINANPAQSSTVAKPASDADRMTLRFVKPSPPAHAASR